MISSSTHNANLDDEIDKIWDQVDPAIKTKLKEKEYKISRFRKSIEELLEFYDSSDILRMDVSCIKSGGAVNKEALNHILFDE